MQFILQCTKNIKRLFGVSVKNLSCSFYKEDQFDSVLVELSGSIGAAIYSWEGTETTVELRILPEQMDEIAQKWMEYRNAANRR